MTTDIPDPAERIRLQALLEAALLASPEPVSLQHLVRATGQQPELIQELLDWIAADYERPEHGIRLRGVGGGYQFSTKPEHHAGLKELSVNLRPPVPMSQQAVETAAVIAMLQPVTAQQIREARHVRNDNVLRTLLRRKLIAPAGRAHTRGRPLQYCTTRRFLVEFGLKDLSELPTIEEFRHRPGIRVKGD
jgi:segregation and condensation protein B